ncbi:MULTISPECIES: S1 family peptidase [Streptomyces]|uniref:S1 family peptidase n=1 Tax=Streptomyces TaxID=1883 RepID=UPI0031D78FA4
MGDPVKDSYGFAAKLEMFPKGDDAHVARSCSAALVSSQWLVSAASCFAEAPNGSTKVAAGTPAFKTRATIGRSDLTREVGTVVDVIEIVPRDDRDVVMAKLARPVTGITPLSVGSGAPLEGEELRTAGYGRTKDEWVPDLLHQATFSVSAVKGATVQIAGKSSGAAVCQGDTGGPLFREVGGRAELVGVNSRSWQGGCLGVDGKETRTDALSARTDDVAAWVQTVVNRDNAAVLRGKDWTKAKHLVPGYFTGGSLGGSRHMDLFVAWEDGSASLFQGAETNNPKGPFTSEYVIGRSGWGAAKHVAAGNFTGSGSDGLVVGWQNGHVTWFPHVNQNGFSEEKELRKEGSETWKTYAQHITVGRYTDNPLRDDMLVVWQDGSVSMFQDLGTNGLGSEKELLKKGAAAQNIEQMTSGEFTGKSTADLMVRWKDGSASIYPGVSATAGFHDEIKIRKQGSSWDYARALAGGAFTANDRAGDVLVRWKDGNVSLYPSVDAAGTHTEVDLLK